jgi:hypothetical protein
MINTQTKGKTSYNQSPLKPCYEDDREDETQSTASDFFERPDFFDFDPRRFCWAFEEEIRFSRLENFDICEPISGDLFRAMMKVNRLYLTCFINQVRAIDYYANPYDNFDNDSTDSAFSMKSDKEKGIFTVEITSLDAKVLI